MPSDHSRILKKFQHEGSQDHLFALIAHARAAATESDHSEYKVGVALHSASPALPDAPYYSNANKIPEKLRAHALGTAKTNGNNPTAHGELMLLKDADPAQKNYLGCNFPNCPTCVKKMIVFGIYAVAIDAHVVDDDIVPRAFDKPGIADRFADGWNNLSLPLLRAAGIHVLGVDPERGKIGIINHGMDVDLRKRPEKLPLFKDPYITIEKPMGKTRWAPRVPEIRRIFDEKANEMLVHTDLAHTVSALAKEEEDGTRIAVARLFDKKGRAYIMAARETLPPGLDGERFMEIEKQFINTRYTVSIDPVMRLMIEAPRRNLTFKDAIVACNYMPHTGRHIDMVACGARSLQFPEVFYKLAKSDPDYCLMKVIEKSDALRYRPLPPYRMTPYTRINTDEGPCRDCTP